MSRPIQPQRGRGRKATYNVTGNVVWLACAAMDRDFPRDPVASLKQSVARLVAEVERSGRLKADIAAAIETRRYEVYRRSTTLGGRASDRGMAAAQRIHVDSLLKFVHALAAAGGDRRADGMAPAAGLDPLARSIRDLEAGVGRARQLSRAMLAQCRDCDWRGNG